MFCTDRDLIVLEPRLFFDVSWTAQKRLDLPTGGAINSAGDTLTVTGADVAALGIEHGFIAVVAGTPVEVIERLNSTQLRISRLRASTNDALIPAVAGAGLKLTIHTFMPQARVVHEQLLRMIGIEPGEASAPGRPAAPDITNPRAFALAEALGTLHLIFTSASAAVGGESLLWTKSQTYRERFAAERKRLVAEIDLDGDGEPDAVRRPSVVQFVR